MTIDATFAAPLTGPMHAMLDNALTPYLEGDLDASDALIDALLEVIAAAEHTPDLISTLHGAIKTLPPTHELMPAMHQAIGAALELDSPTPTSSGYANTGSSRAATARTSSGHSREGSIAARIKSVFTKNPGTEMRVGDLVKALSTMGYDHSGGAVGAALNGLVARGEAVQVGEKPKLYLAADDSALPQQATDTDEDASGETPTTPDAQPDTSEADKAPSDTSEADKAPASRRTTGKTAAK